MSVNWSRVFNISYSACGPDAGSSACSPSCYNFSTSSTTAARGSILAQFPLSIQTTSQVFSLYAEELKDRLSAKKFTITSPSETEFFITLQLSQKISSRVLVTIRTNAGGNYPVYCSYEYQKKNISGTSSFNDLNQMLDWVVSSLTY